MKLGDRVRVKPDHNRNQLYCDNLGTGEVVLVSRNRVHVLFRKSVTRMFKGTSLIQERPQ